MAEPHVHVTQWTVSVLPLDHVEHGHFSITVEWRGSDRWAVTRFRECLDIDGVWDFEPSPLNRADDWLETHRFTMDEALELAKREAPHLTVNGFTVADVLGEVTDDT